MQSAQGEHAVVIGGGIVGTCTALELNSRGYRVTLIDAAPPGGPQGASFGNGAMLSTASSIPLSVPGMWKKVPGYLLDKRGALVIRWRDLGYLAPWLVKFLFAGVTWSRMKRISDVLARLLHDGPNQHHALSQAAGVDALIVKDGIIYTWKSYDDFQAERPYWDLRRAQGIAFTMLDKQALRDIEPDLGEAYSFAVHVPSAGACLNPGHYVAALAELLARRGGGVIKGQVRGVTCSGTTVAISLADDSIITADKVVIAAGIASKDLAKGLGEDVPMIAERGYHVQLDSLQGGPRHALMPMDGKMAITTLNDGIRAAGQVELGRLDASPNWTRAEILKDHLLRCFPQIDANQRPRFWYGSRPSLPDCLPIISKSAKHAQVFYAFGHGHIGLSSGPETAKRVADLMMTGRCTDDDALSITRFQN